MEKTFTELYKKEELPVLKRKERIFTAAAIASLAASFAACAVICALAGRAHDPILLPIVILISTLGGWTAITLWRFPALGYRHAYRHTEAMLEPEHESDTEIVEGSFELTKDRLLIIGGVAMVRVKASSDGSVRSLQIYDKKKKLLDPDASRVRVVNGFITAYKK